MQVWDLNPRSERYERPEITTSLTCDIIFFLLFLSFIYILYNTLEEKCKYFWLFYVEKLYFGYCQAHFLLFFSPFLIYNIIINPKARKMQVFWAKICWKCWQKGARSWPPTSILSSILSTFHHFFPQHEISLHILYSSLFLSLQ